MSRRLATFTILVAVLAACGGSTPLSTSDPTPTTTTAAPPQPGDLRTDASGVDQVWVPAGTFTMGSTDAPELEMPAWAQPGWDSEHPAHEVTISRGYWIDRYEVTNASFDAFAAAGGYADRSLWSEAGLRWLDRQDLASLPVQCTATGPDHPRACITWYEAEAYAAWRGGRLPTEAEWEFAARGPASSVFPWGDDWDPSLANLVDSTGTVTVGSRLGGTSWVGAADMSGNVMEWVADWWSPFYYAEAAPIDPTGPEDGSRKVEKGGWWGSVPFVGRAAYRHFEDGPSYRDHHIGVRIATDAVG